MTFYSIYNPFRSCSCKCPISQQDCFINPSFLEMAYACNRPANYRCRQSVSLLSGSLRRGPIPRLQRHSGRFCEHLVAGSKDLSEELFSPSRAIKYRPHRPHRLECGRLQVVCAVGMDYFHRPRRRPYHPQPTDSDRGVEWAGVPVSQAFLDFNVLAVGAVDVLRTSPPTSVFAGNDG